MFQQDPAEYRLTHHSQSDTLDKAREPDLIQGTQVIVPDFEAGKLAWTYQRPTAASAAAARKLSANTTRARCRSEAATLPAIT